MNRNITLLFFVVFLVSQGIAQNENIVLNEHFKDAPLQEVLNCLEQKYQLKITYEHEAIQGIFIDKKIKKQTLATALQLVFENTPLEYELVHNEELLIRKKVNSSNISLFSIHGKIFDSTNHEPLPYASIYINEAYGTESDALGAFVLNAPITTEPLQLNIQYVGYEPQIVTLDKTKINQPCTIQLQTQTLEIASITIVEQTPAVTQNAAAGSMTLNVDALSRLPSFVGGKDVFRGLQMLPGISAHDDLSADLSIRGSNGDENMIVMDGITLYNVGHYFGIFSAINPNVADKVTVYKNAFPVEYGGRTAGVVDISTNELRGTKAHGGLEINLLTSDAWLQLPLGKKMGLLVGGRITNKDLADTPLFDPLNQKTQNPQTINNFTNLAAQKRLTSIEPDFRFNDFNAKWNWQITSNTSATASFFRGYDRFDYTIEQDFKTRPENQILNNTYKYSEEVDWNNHGASFQLAHQWQPNVTSNVTLSNSSYWNAREVSNYLLSENPIAKDSTESEVQQYNGINAWDLNVKTDWSIKDHHLLTFGYNLVDSDVNLAIDINDKDILKKQSTAQQHALFLQYKTTWQDKLDVHLGLRNTYYTETQKWYLSPRISAAYALDDHWQIKGAWSYYHQFLRQSYHEDRFGRTFDFWVLGGNVAFPLAHSKNSMLGFRYLHHWFDVDVELYQKRATGMIEHALVVTGFDGENINASQSAYKVFSGTGLTRGMDILLKKTSGAYTGWVAYTLSKSTNRFPDIRNNAPFPAQNDRRHQLKIINQYEWGNWDFSATYVFSSGRPYTDLSILSEMPEDRDQLRPEDRLSYLEDYHRVDIGVNYNFSLWSGKAQIGASVFNLFNRKNVKYRQYVYTLQDRDNDNSNIKSTVIGTELEMLGITPNVSFSWAF